MTIKELYEWGKRRNALDKEITINYTCNDDWYNYYEDFDERNLTEDANEVIIDIDAT